ncbi:metallophosphoesterase [Zhouia sp. PK063]|uniref:metallophosphoesterase n=1 Tax=Zhouia sp. PK063 TaxID=3373602 RepID=UPI0037AC3D37
MILKNTLLLFVVLLVFASCATKNIAQYSDKDNQPNYPSNQIDHSFYLIGDAGNAPEKGTTPSLTALQKVLDTAKAKKSMVIFLGDNLYPDGLPKKHEKGRDLAEHRLQAQADISKKFKGKVLFIPGNHDWYRGIGQLKDEEKFIEKALDDKDGWQPENGCPLEDFDIGKNIKLLVVDTQWYLEDWDKIPTINDECDDIKTRDKFFIELEGEIKKAQGKTLIIAMHHPMFTNGVHGGNYAFTKHLFPSQRKVPLPILGSLAAQIRTQGGVSKQDRYNARYKELMDRIEVMVKRKSDERIILASGHEHTLQYLINDGIHQIVSGSGSKASYARLGDDGLFTYGGEGFAVLDVFKDGSSFIRYYSGKGGDAKLLFQQKVFKKPATYEIDTLKSSYSKTITTSIYPKEFDDKSGFFKTVWGKHYRKIYSTPVQVPVAILDTLYGGLKVVRPGGGHQTRSLRLVDKKGHEYNMRALKKSAVQFLQTVAFKNEYVQKDLKNTLPEDLVMDFYTAANPFGAFAIPTLSDAAQILHTNPKLYYIPKQKALGNYNADYGDELYMIVERPEPHFEDKRSFGYPDDIESTDDLLHKLRKDEKYKVNEEAYIRARMFDMMVGDWDRHDDQWRWSEFKYDNGVHEYYPIPRDRDQVFSNFDGDLFSTIRALIGLTNQFQVYDDDLKDVKWMNIEGIKLDRALLMNDTREAWVKQAEFIKNHVSDEVIEKAFTHLPKEVQNDESTQEIIGHLKARRDNLVQIANRYYNQLASFQIVTATDKDDFIDITRLPEGKTQIKIWRNKDGKREDLMVNNTFNHKDTKEIWVYGLDDDDRIKVTGKGDHPILVRIVGGQNNDIYDIENGKKIKVYDHKTKPNTIEENHGANIRLTDIYDYNIYDYKKEILHSNNILPALGFNPDDGMKIGLKDVFTINGFKRNPFSQQHTFTLGYFFATSGFDFNYSGEFANIFGKFNLRVEARLTSPNYADNFFGFGNESQNLEDEYDRDYNRVKISDYTAKVGVVKQSSYGSYFNAMLSFEGIKVDDTDGRYIDIYNVAFNPGFFDRKYFAGVEATYKYESYDVALNPTRGMIFQTTVGGKTNVNDTNRTFGYVNPHLGFYNSLTRNRKWVLKTDVRGQFNIGDNFEFYQGAQLGGATGLRGYRNERFTGNSALAFSGDIRYSFNEFRTGILPVQIGVFGGYDVGRVWYHLEDSNQWHDSYGGGVWINSSNVLNGTFNLFNSDDGLRFSFALGFNF